MLRVFLVDDHEMVRRGIAGLLSSDPGIEVVGEAATAAQARARILVTKPDVAILDVRLPDGSGVDVCRDVRAVEPGIRCLMLTSYDDDAAIYAAVIAGAAGYLMKDVLGSNLVQAVRDVGAGRSLLDPTLTKRVLARMAGIERGDARLDSLSPRERQILALIGEGLTNREIGDRLSLAEKTVKNYVSTMLSKLGLHRRTQAAILHVTTEPGARA
ncbi:MAG: DNA-binding response regulator [Microbacteriaceae bacterium]|jgi:two-component system response regulator DevR|nr:DNA-binding response regulator [Microbacteriaceae bacterium]